MKTLPIAFLLLTSATKFNLPVEVVCNGKPLRGMGGVICAQAEPPSSLKVKLPPTRGQLRVTDCDQDLTLDGNPDDFNTQIERQGWWIFARTVRVLSETPTFPLPRKSYDDCGLTVSVVGENTGVQTADVIFDTRVQGAFAVMTCGGVVSKVDKVGVCRALEGARLEFGTSEQKGTMVVIGSSCRVSSQIDLSARRSVALQVPEGRCVIDLGWVNGQVQQRSRVLVLGQSRESRELDNPLMVRDGDKRRVYKPIGASLTSTEIYQEDKVLWRSGSRDDDSYSFEDKGWPPGSIACHTSYSQALQSISGSCYNLDSDKEVPYFFK